MFTFVLNLKLKNMETVQLLQMSLEELYKLNDKVVSIIKAKRELESKLAINDFNIGDNVKYIGGTNKIKNETFKVRKTKRINILCESVVTGELWNIKPIYLNKI